MKIGILLLILLFLTMVGLAFGYLVKNLIEYNEKAPELEEKLAAAKIESTEKLLKAYKRYTEQKKSLEESLLHQMDPHGIIKLQEPVII